MDNQNRDLWQGGPWEQPSADFLKPPAVTIPSGAMRPRQPVLRSRRSKRAWPIFLGLAILMVTLFLAAAKYNGWFSMAGMSFPFGDMPDFYYDYGYGYDDSEEDYSTEPPAIPQAATGTGVTVELKTGTGVPLTYTEIYEKNAPSLVSIEVQDKEGYGTGAGIILTEDGYLLTNAHVVAGAEKVQVVFYDNQVKPASLVGFNAQEDIAVLKVEVAGLIPAEFGNSSELRCGDIVAAIGDPLGYRSTITDGIVSSLDREVEMDGSTMMLIQTSAAINFGNSGGALINQYGQVVGITTIKIVTDDGSAEGLGFAIPSVRVKYVADALIDGREIRTGIFGFTVNSLPVEGGGLKVIDVDPASDCHAKGLRVGDILQFVNGQPLNSTRELSRVKQTLAPGDTVTLTWLRDGDMISADVALIDPDDLTE